MPTVLWWGRFDADYSRNRILRKLLGGLGWAIVDFHPRFSAVADWEARARRLPTPDLVWVPCFRQRDLAAASRWAHARRVPLLFDPLISAYDKQVFEREKYPESSEKAARLLRRERALFRRADILLADTAEHARFFTEVLEADPRRVHVVFVGAEESLFHPGESMENMAGEVLEALFYGSFIPLQGAVVIVEAARRYTGPPVRWTLVGAGPELAACKQAAAGLPNVAFEPWIDYAALPGRIRRADILLGVFGATAKAGRVIPNKVFQALACGKPVVTRRSPAYPEDVADRPGKGLIWVDGGDARGLADAVAGLAGPPGRLGQIGREARATFESHFSETAIGKSLADALATLPEPAR
jgi:glycosyltransferase involved in cell wall biosynthesis